MNGDERGYLEKLLNEKFDNLHHRFTELREDTKAISTKFDKLPCDTYSEKIKGQGKSLDRAWVWIYGIVIGFILTGAGFLIIRSVLAQ